jgi:hypothetical protein
MADLVQTYGSFELIGKITVVPNDTFQTDLKGKNSPTYNYSRINMKMEDDKGGTFWLSSMGGFDTVNALPIQAKIKESTTNEKMKVAFIDRKNEEILKHLDDSSFIKVALRKIEVEGRKIWDYQKFLSLYDVISFLKDRLESGMKLYVWGQTRYSLYNGDLNKNYDIKEIRLLPEDDELPLGFKFTQQVYVTPESVDMDKWESEGTSKVTGKVYVYNKGKNEVINLPLVVRSTEENKPTLEKVINKYLKVNGDKVRLIRLEGRYNNGYAAGNVTEADLPDEAKELIEDEIYSLEEVLKLYANKGQRVDEMNIVRPFVVKPKNANEKPHIDMKDDFSIEDLKKAEVAVENKPTDIEVPWDTKDEDEDLSFLEDL